MRIEEVIESKVWRHSSGRTASIYGACPWRCDAERGDWTLEIVGWTWRNSNGTVGLERVPAATREEAEAIMAEINDADRQRTKYNGWANYETWNVALWIDNDEGFYHHARSVGSYRMFVETVREICTETPDGVAWNDSSLDTEALDEMVEELST